MTVNFDRYPGHPKEGDSEEQSEWRSIAEAEAWAKNHKTTCRALKDSDADLQ